MLWVGVYPARERRADTVELVGERPDVPGRVNQLLVLVHAGPASAIAKLYGGHGPVQTIPSSGCSACSRSRVRRNSSTFSRSTRYAAVSASLGVAPTVSVASRASRVSGRWS